jgi:hypothetical protein
MSEEVKNNEATTNELNDLQLDYIQDLGIANADALSIEATTLVAEAEADAKADAEAEAMLLEASTNEDPAEVEEPDEAKKDEEPEAEPEGEAESEASIEGIEERIDELVEIGRAAWTPEQRREYRRLDQALEAYESGSSVADVAKADGVASSTMGEEAITLGMMKKFDRFKDDFALTTGNHFGYSLWAMSRESATLEYGEGDDTKSVPIGPIADTSIHEIGTFAFSWNESEPTQTVEYHRRKLVNQLLMWESIRTNIVEGLGIPKGAVEFNLKMVEGEPAISNPTYTAKVGKGKGGVLGSKKESDGWWPKGYIVLEEPFKYGGFIIPAGKWLTIASMFDTKRDSSKNFSEENLNRNGGDWGELAKYHSNDAKTHTLHRKGYKNPDGATTGYRVIEGLFDAMPVESAKELAEALKVGDGKVSYAEASPKFRKLFGYDEEVAELEGEGEADDVTNNDVEGNE